MAENTVNFQEFLKKMNKYYEDNAAAKKFYESVQEKKERTEDCEEVFKSFRVNV